MSLRTLKRKLKSLSLSRQKDYASLSTVHAAMHNELKGPGQHCGYHSMWHTLHLKYSLRVKRDNVMALMRKLIPQGIQLRANRTFIKRVHSSNGPNHVWHVDRYGKLKPYGLGLSGCIDGFSQKVLWLRCGASNNDPGVIAQNYLNCLSECEIIPM